MDVYDQLNQLAATVRGAKTMPMSASCLVNRAEMLDVLERLRDELPVKVDHVDAPLSESDAVVAKAQEQVERLLEGARREREQLIEQTDVLVAARARAFTVVTEARAESTRLLADADDYVDRKLAEFEAVLGRLQSQVNNGRQRLVARREADLARLQGAGQGPWSEEGAHPNGFRGPGATSVPAVGDHQGAGEADVSVGAR